MTIFAELEPSFPGDPQGSLGGIGIALGQTGFESVKYLSGIQPIAQAQATPLPAALPLFATGLGALGLIGWRRRQKTQRRATC